MNSKQGRTKLIAAIVTILAAFGVYVTISATDNNPSPPATKTVTLGGPGHKTITLTPPAQEIVKDAQKDDKLPASKADAPNVTENDLNAPPPDPSTVDQSQDLQPPGQPEIPANAGQGASVSTPGCQTKLVRNYSSRRGAPVLLGVIHWTGSRPTPGSAASGLAIVSWFDQSAAQASSNEISDQDGRCWLVVPESQKAWTQAQYNPWAVSVEIVNQGVQPLFQKPAARNVVLKLMRGWHARWKIPYRRGVVTQSGCRVVRSGYLAHRDLGRCGGGHPDVGSYDLDRLIRDAANGGNCNAKCRRTQDLKTRLSATVKELHRRNCGSPATTHSTRCKTLHRRRAAIHTAAKKEGIRL